MVFIFTMPGKDRLPAKTELAGEPRTEVKPEPKPDTGVEVKLEPKPEDKPEPKSTESERKPDAKPEPKQDALQIWPNPTRGDEFNDMKKYKFPGMQGAASAGLSSRGFEGLDRLQKQIKNAKTAGEQDALMERVRSVWKASVVDAQLNKPRFLEPMVAALEANNLGEFDRLANKVNAIILVQSASQLGMSADKFDKLDAFVKQVDDAKTAADQREPIEQMQKVYNMKK